MRNVVMGMMTTLNGRLDDPAAWVTGVPDDLYAELDRLYATFDTILVGRTTYDEMVEYWPGAETEAGGSESSRSMGEVLAHGDEDVVAFVNDLKAQPGGDIHLSGGARLAKTLVRLGLVDLRAAGRLISGRAGWPWRP